MIKNFLVTVMSVAWFFAPKAQASLTVLQSHQVSSECGQVTHEVVSDKAYDDSRVGSVGESLRLFFSDFYVQSEKAERKERKCRLSAVLSVPAGYRFMPLSASAEGIYNINPAGTNTGGIKVSYVVQPGQMVAERTNKTPFTGQGDIHCLAELKEPKFTGCFNKATTVSLETDLALWLDQKAPGNSLIQLDATRRNQNLYWNWRLQSCENFFDQKTFDSQYQAFNLQTYDARLKFDFRNGTYESSAGFVGQLRNLSYSEDGLTLTGQWEASSSRGSFSFSMKDTRTGAFTGHWDDDKGHRYPWKGAYAGGFQSKQDYHSFRTPDGKLCLDSGTQASPESMVTMMPCHNGPQQQFYTPRVLSLYSFHIKSRTHGMCMTAQRKSDGSYSIKNTICGKMEGSSWEFFARGQSPFKLQNTMTGLCLVNDPNGSLSLADCKNPPGADGFFVWVKH